MSRSALPGWIRIRAFCTLLLITLAVLAVIQWTQQRSEQDNGTPSVDSEEATSLHRHLEESLLSRLDLRRSQRSRTSQAEPTGRLPRVAIADRTVLGHDEVMGPLLYTLSTMMGIRPKVYRNTFRDGFKWLNAPHFSGPFRPAKDMYHEGNLADLDVLILATGDLDLSYFINHPEIIDAHPRLRIVAVCHHAQNWVPLLRHDKKRYTWHTRTDALAATSRWHAEGRLSYLTLSPHVSQTLSDLFTRLNVTSGDLLRVETYIPVMPLRGRAPRSDRKALTQAVLQGTISTRARDYNRVFGDFVQEMNTNSKLYGYQTQDDGQHRQFRPDAQQLHLVGEYEKKSEAFITVPPALDISTCPLGRWLSPVFPVAILIGRGRHLLDFPGMPNRRFSLGSFGYVINVLAVRFVIFTIIFFLFPPAIPVNAKSMNYTVCVIIFLILAVCGITWLVSGRKHDTGPRDIDALLTLARHGLQKGEVLDGDLPAGMGARHGGLEAKAWTSRLCGRSIGRASMYRQIQSISLHVDCPLGTTKSWYSRRQPLRKASQG